MKLLILTGVASSWKGRFAFEKKIISTWMLVTDVDDGC